MEVLNNKCLMFTFFLVTSLFANKVFAEPKRVIKPVTNGLIIKKSNYSVEKTIAKLKKQLLTKKIHIIAHIDHAKNAKQANVSLLPTQLLIFGNPNLGSHIISSQQTVGIDLPMKVIVWLDVNKQVWLAYNSPAYIATRHGIIQPNEYIKKMAKALDKVTTIATK